MLLLRSPQRKRRRKAGAPPRQLGDLFSVGETQQPPRKPDRLGAQAGQRVSRQQPPPAEAGGGRPRSPPAAAAAQRAATGFRSARRRYKARIGGWLEAGAPAEARAAVLRAETTLSACSRVSGAAEESIIQIFVTASSSPSASRWVQQSPATHRRADTHTPQNLLQCFSLCLATPEQEPTPLISGSQNPKTKDSSISSTWLLSRFLSYTKPKSP